MTRDRVLTASLLTLALLMGLGGAFFLPFALAFGFLVLFPILVAFLGIMGFRLANRYLRRADRFEQRSHHVNFEWAPSLSGPDLPLQRATERRPLLSTEDEIAQLRSQELEELVSMLPSDSSVHETFIEQNGLWCFRFHSRSTLSDFVAEGFGPSPRAAFQSARDLLKREIEEWRRARDSDQYYLSPASMVVVPEGRAHIPTALIVDDDEDSARVTSILFERMGCKAFVARDVKEAHSRLLQEDVDFVVLDWLLSETDRGGQIVERANKFIESFDDLQTKFSRKQPKLVTYSVLDEGQIEVPKSPYFSYFDHWRKPSKYEELADRTSRLISAAGY